MKLSVDAVDHFISIFANSGLRPFCDEVLLWLLALRAGSGLQRCQKWVVCSHKMSTAAHFLRRL